MKRIDEIEKLSLQDLEKISLDESIEIPSGLEARLDPTVLGRSSRRLLFWVPGIAASLVLVVGLALSVKTPKLEDTFDDPAIAYAEVEKALVRVSETIVNQVNKTY